MPANGNNIKWKDKTLFEKIYACLKLLGLVAVAVTAVFSYLQSNRASEKADAAPAEQVTKAANDKLVSRLNSLGADVESRDKALRRYLRRSVAEMAKKVHAAETESKACRSLFVGFALAGVRNPQAAKTRLENLTKTIARSGAKAAPAPAPPKATKPTFRKAQRWEKIKQQVQQRTAPAWGK